MRADRELARGTLPTLYLLRSAYRVSRLLGTEPEPVRDLREAYRRLPTDGLFDEGAFRRGEALLKDSGLLELGGGRVRADERITVLRRLEEREACRVLLALILEGERPLWLRVAVGATEVRDSYIPEHVRGRLKALFPDPDDRNAFLVALGHVDPFSRSELGRLGEEVVVGACREQRYAAGLPQLAEEVQRVSRLSDGFGYDVSAPCPEASAYHLEVKTVGRGERPLTIHLSRHQVQVGRRDPRWVLVVCRRTGEGIELVGWSRIDRLEECWPENRRCDQQMEVRWTEVEVVLIPNALTPGLPPLVDLRGRLER